MRRCLRMRGGNFVLNEGTGVANSLPYIVKCSTDGLVGAYRAW